MRIVVPLPPAGLRRNAEAHRFTVQRLKDAYSVDVMQACIGVPRGQLCGDLSVFIVWRQTGPGDVDNCLASCKVVLDCLAQAPVTKAGANRFYCGLFESDSQIKRITVEREQVKRKDRAQVELTFTPYEERT